MPVRNRQIRNTKASITNVSILGHFSNNILGGIVTSLPSEYSLSVLLF